MKYSEIVINQDKTLSYFNQLAHQVLYKHKKATYFKLQENENCFVFEDVGEVDLVCRLGFNEKHLSDVKTRYNEAKYLFVLVVE